MRTGLAIAIMLSCVPAFSGDWNPRLAADYLDARQKDWFAWPAATKSGAPCISCHTGMTYMLVRPGLRNVLGEKESTEYERGFLQTMRSHAGKKPAADAPKDSTGTQVDTILSAMLLAAEDAPNGKLSAETEQAFNRLWASQAADGAWSWYNLELDPWEMPESRFYGAAIAALAVGCTPAEYRERPEVREHVGRLIQFLNRGDAGQPLHNRLMLLWAASKLPEAASTVRRNSIVEQATQTQQPDGGWTIASLGPWTAHPMAPAAPASSAGSNAYATAFAAFAMEQAGVPASDPRLKRALTWLRAHQDKKGGYWDAVSMNKKYEAGSMMELFMRDAATGFAAMALLNGDSSR